jgi:hypothetical protein
MYYSNKRQLVFTGFRIPEPDRDLDQASETCVLVTATYQVDGQWEARDTRQLPHLCKQNSPRALAFVRRFGCHSPDGFNWGYHGSGPAELALMLLLQIGLRDETAWDLHQRFKDEVIAKLPQLGPWVLPEYVVRDWVTLNDRATADTH